MVTTLKTYVGADARDEDFITECALEAAALVNERCKGSTVPEPILARAILEVGAELYKRRASQTGSTSMENPEMRPLSARNDPMKAATFILGPFLEPGLA